MASSVAIIGRNKARILTENVLLAHESVLEVTSADPVRAYFGETSEEYKAAVKFFETANSRKSGCRTLQFAPCNHKYGDKVFDKYTVTAGKNKVTCVKDSNGKTLEYANIVECFRDIPPFSTLNVKLTEDIVFVSETTKAATNRDFTEATSTTDNDLLHGIVVRDDVKATIDLNGKQLSFDIHVFTNNGNLIITDKSAKKDGRCYTTNFDGTVDGVPHTDSSWDKGACECIINYGNLRIEDGWFGTNKADALPRVNDVNWGVCIQNAKHGFTYIKGGHFTTVSNGPNSEALQTWANSKREEKDMQNSFLPTVDKNVIGSDKNPWAFVFELHYGGRMVMEGGQIFGCSNGGVAVIGDYERKDGVITRQETTEDDYNAFTMIGGEIVNGFKGSTIPSGIGINQYSSFVFAGANATNDETTNAHSDQSNSLPSNVLPLCFSRADIRIGQLTDTFTSRENFVLSGRVHCEFGVTLENCTVRDEFKNLVVRIGEPVRRVTLGQSVLDTHSVDMEFYNAAFLNDVKVSELEELHSALDFLCYMHNVVCKVEGLEDNPVLPEIGGGIGVTTERDDAFAECAVVGALPTKLR